MCIAMACLSLHASAQIVDTTKSLSGDSTIQTFRTDTSQHKKRSRDTLDAPVHHKAKGSEWIDAPSQKMYLLDSAIISYKDITLSADSIIFDMKDRIVYSYGRKDTFGKMVGLPVFKQGVSSYNADEIAYDFKTGKGRIVKVTTSEGEGFIHSAVVKRFPDNVFYGLNNEYTTCNRADPDYYIAANKIEVIPGRAVVTGPANLVIEGVRTPLFLPFGIFPLADKRKSGLIIPTYGEASNLGFYLKGLGYYFGISDHMDASLTGDIYSYGSWGVNATVNYLKRYKFSGQFYGSYASFRTFDPETDRYTSSPQYILKINFAEDSKARPNSRFQGSVNVASSLYDQTFGIQPQTFLTNTYQSSISYSGVFPRSPFTYSLSLSHSQNVATHQLSLQLPLFNLTMNQINPFKSSISGGRPKWYENIGLSYRVDGQNNLSTIDTTLFQSQTLQKFIAGVQHNVSLVAPFTVLKHINFSPTASYTETWSFSTIRQQWNPDFNQIQSDTIHAFAAARNFNTGISASTILYGIVQFRHGTIRAIRHVMTPSIGFSYHPDFSQPQWNAFKTVQLDSLGNTKKYSIFSSSPYFGPSAGKFGGLNFSLNNNLEMKVRSEKDTVSGLKKITLIDAFNLGMSYNLAVDSFRLSPLNISAHSTLFNKFQVTYSASFDPYAVDTTGRRINEYEWAAHHKLFRMTNTSIGLSGTISSPHATSGLSKASPGQAAYIVNSGNDFVDFNIPWSISPNYTLNIQKINIAGRDSLVFSQALGLSGNFNLTQKWKVNFSSSYDFLAHQVSYVYMSIVRDLHCWTMAVSANPFGPRAGFSLTIQVQASILQDLRLPLRKGYENEYGY